MVRGAAANHPYPLLPPGVEGFIFNNLIMCCSEEVLKEYSGLQVHILQVQYFPLKSIEVEVESGRKSK